MVWVDSLFWGVGCCCELCESALMFVGGGFGGLLGVGACCSG